MLAEMIKYQRYGTEEGQARTVEGMKEGWGEKEKRKPDFLECSMN